jgi:transcriptional regulator with XRE-family HTH domain
MIKRKRKTGPKPGTLYKNVTRTEIGIKLAALRREKGISQQTLAERTGLTKRVISYYEREAKTIPSNNLQKIAKAFNVEVDLLLNHEVQKSVLKQNRAFLKRLEKAKNLPPEKQKLISDLIDNLIS